MKIAFIEFEYPPDTAKGGIATYTWEASRALTKRGHYVEVFAGSKDHVGSALYDGVMVHRIDPNPVDFVVQAGCAFKSRNEEIGFDVLEGAELKAPAREAIRLVPEMPLVVRLHVPTFKLLTMSDPALNFVQRVRVLAGNIRRGRMTPPEWVAVERIEREHAGRADVIAATSGAVGELVRHRWKLDPTRMIVSPLPFSPDPALLEIPPGSVGNTVTFVGHVCVGKGMVELVDAMQVVMAQKPMVNLNLVGNIGSSPTPHVDMRKYVLDRLGKFASRIRIDGPVPRHRMQEVFRETDILVLPSHWDTFPVACLEAMAAARAIVGTTSGGMTEMLDGGSAGKLVPPFQFRRLASAILEFVDNLALRAEMGDRARRRVLTEFGVERTVLIQEKCYMRAIETKRRGVSQGHTVDA